MFVSLTFKLATVFEWNSQFFELSINCNFNFAAPQWPKSNFFTSAIIHQVWYSLPSNDQKDTDIKFRALL